jgi:hypothetical protein
MDRSVVIPMRRKRREEGVEILLGHRLDADTLPLRQRLVRFADDEAEALQSMLPRETPGLRDRAIDNWSPLFAIADVVGGDWPVRARKAAVVLSGGSEASDDTPGLQLLEDCHAIWRDSDHDADQIASADLVKQLNELPDRPWADFRSAKGISAAWLAKRLGAFDVAPAGTMRFNGKQCRGYRWSAFIDAWERYLILQPSQCPNANKSGPELPISNRPATKPGRMQKRKLSQQIRACGTVVGIHRQIRGDGTILTTDGVTYDP